MKLKSLRLNGSFGSFGSILEGKSDTDLIYQKPDELSIHRPDKKWLLLTSEVGYFNKITQFICGDLKSILFMDVNGELVTPSITEVMNDPQQYFMLYPLPFTMYQETNNNEVEFFWESKKFNRTKSNTEKVTLDFKLGTEIGKTFFYYEKDNKIPLTNFEEAINGSNTSDYFWPHKNLIINSNPEFVLGILFGYLKISSEIFFDEKEKNPKNPSQPISLKEKLYINKTNNSYIFSTILNWLGASYSFQPIQLREYNEFKCIMKMHITLPHYLLGIFNKVKKEFPDYDEFKKIFKSHEWYITNKNKVRKMPIGAKEKAKLNYNNLIDSGKIRIVPMSSFKFVDVTEKEKKLDMYDFSMPRADATNYALGFTPILKNSDGDILTMSAISSQEAIEDAKVFEPSHKGWFRNLNNGEINNYISDDAVLGLYAATKNIK